MHLVSGALKTLLERPAPKNVARVQLAPISSGEAAALCTRIYADIAEVKPDLPEWATPQDAQSLADAASDGLLWQVLVDETQAGVLAFAARGEQGVHGYSVEEICLDAPVPGAETGECGTVARYEQHQSHHCYKPRQRTLGNDPPAQCALTP